MSKDPPVTEGPSRFRGSEDEFVWVKQPGASKTKKPPQPGPKQK